MANIFEINRSSNKITLGTTGTTINVPPNAASQLLGLDASKNLESVTSPVLTGLTLTGFTGVLWSDAGVITGDAPINELSNLTANKTFNNAANSISFNFTNPTNQPTYDGAFEIQVSGVFEGDLLHVHQHGGNPGTTDLIHAEAEDVDVTLLRLSHSIANGICLAIGGHGANVATIDIEGDALFNTLSITSVAAEGADVDKFLVDSSNVVKYRTGAEVLADIGGSASGHDHSGVYEPLDVVLTDLAALAVVADNEFIVGTGAGVYAHESGATARTSIGLGTTATPTFRGMFISGQNHLVFQSENNYIYGYSISQLHLVSTGEIHLTAGGAYSLKIIHDLGCHFNAGIYITEQASAGGSSAAIGQVWTKSGTPNTLWFTDDTGGDFQLGEAHDYSDISGNDGATDITAIELEELTNGSETILHSHADVGTVFGAWNDTKSNNTIYQAATDGFVCAEIGGTNVELIGYTDSSDDPTIIRTRGSYNDPTYKGDGITMPVRKDDYWKVTGAGNVYWLPIGG